MDVHYGLSGDRRVTVQRADHSRIVAEHGGRGGYVQRAYMFRGHEFAHRTYFANGRAYDHFYRPYRYRGINMEVYAPVSYYPVGFYGWVYNPWIQPAPYAWGWTGTPWYGYYSRYFTPAPVYPSASLWLTDYMISNALADAYQARIDSGQTPQPVIGQAAVSSDVKALISGEVQRQIALENSESIATARNQDPDPQSSGIARQLSDGVPHVYLVGQSLDLVDVTGKECMVSSGDVLQLKAAAPNANNANLMVIASKGGQECSRSTTVSVMLSDLQDMQNYMRETIDQGLGKLQNDQGKGGLPHEPATAAGAAMKASFAVSAPPPEPNCANEIAAEAQESDKVEFELGQRQNAQGTSEQTSASGGSASNVIAVGMTLAQITAILGQPKATFNKGANQKVFIYANVKITFTAGKVTDLQ
ncbi:MAG TPA: hypothetical protein VME17_15755 [Bryobacteraceae bacterium]|nr:hypothetical protein [Bryobacteraceae bacterium]